MTCPACLLAGRAFVVSSLVVSNSKEKPSTDADSSQSIRNIRIMHSPNASAMLPGTKGKTKRPLNERALYQRACCCCL
jgi:hypothetical protein